MTWSLPTTDITLRTGEVHAWRADLLRMKEKRTILESILSTEEQSRLLRFRFDQDRLWFILRRGVLRKILGFYTGILPENIQFTRESSGKPMLTAPLESRWVSFNVSHSSGMAVFAVAKHIPTGVDVEFLGRIVDVEELAKRFFSLEEREVLISAPVERRKDAFIKTWTLKEAYIKGLGRGLDYPLDRFAVSMDPGGSPMLAYDNETPSENGQWDFHFLYPGKGYCAALVVRSRGASLRLWDAAGLI